MQTTLTFAIGRFALRLKHPLDAAASANRGVCWRGLQVIVWAFVLTTAPGARAGEPGPGIHVDVTGLRSERGQVICYLFASAAGFPADAGKAAATVRSSIAGRRAGCDFPVATPGRYAVAVVHDEANQGRLNRNALGLPTSGVGASNNPGGGLGPPSFDDAAFLFTGGRKSIAVQMKYLF